MTESAVALGVVGIDRLGGGGPSRISDVGKHFSAWSHSIHLPRGGVWGGDPFRSSCDVGKHFSAWSHSIHLPRGGVWGGDPFRSSCDLQFPFTSSGLVFEYLIFAWFGL